MPGKLSGGNVGRGVALAASMLVVASCGRFHRGEGTAPAMVIFVNESLDQADVYALASGMDARRIGTVMAGRTDTLTVPVDVTTRGTVNIVARIFASNRAASTGQVSVYPGQVYQVRLPQDEKLLSFLPAS